MQLEKKEINPNTYKNYNNINPSVATTSEPGSLAQKKTEVNNARK